VSLWLFCLVTRTWSLWKACLSRACNKLKRLVVYSTESTTYLIIFFTLRARNHAYFSCLVLFITMLQRGGGNRGCK
jgi:hypothetical protein